MSAARSHHVCMVLHEGFPPDVRVEKEAHALREAGHEVTLLCRGDESDPRTGLAQVGSGDPKTIQIIRLRRSSPAERTTAIASAAANVAAGIHPRWLAAISRVVARRDATAIHVHDLPLVQTGLLAGRRHGIPVVADLHENYPEAVRQWRETAPSAEENPLAAAKRAAVPVSRWKRRERRIVPRADRILTVAPEAREHYLEDCDVDPDRVQVVSNTVDLATFDPDAATADDLPDDAARPTPDRFTATFVGGFGAHRGLETVIRAVAETDTHVELLLVGDGPNADDLRALADRVGVRDRVSLAGWVDFENVPAYIAASDACLVPHAATRHTETTIPHKLFQYMAMGKPVVVSDLSPLRRVVEDANAGHIAAAGNPNAFAEALSELAEDREQAAQYGENGRQAVEREYNWDRDAERLRSVYADMVAESSHLGST